MGISWKVCGVFWLDQVPKEAHRGWKSTVIQVVFGLIKLVNNLDVASTDGYRLYKAKH